MQMVRTIFINYTKKWNNLRQSVQPLRVTEECRESALTRFFQVVLMVFVFGSRTYS